MLSLKFDKSKQAKVGEGKVHLVNRNAKLPRDHPRVETESGLGPGLQHGGPRPLHSARNSPDGFPGKGTLATQQLGKRRMLDSHGTGKGSQGIPGIDLLSPRQFVLQKGLQADGCGTARPLARLSHKPNRSKGALREAKCSEIKWGNFGASKPILHFLKN